MNELITFTTRELTFFFSFVAVTVLVLIQSRRFFKELIPKSFGFSSKYFMVGLSVGISSCIALANWTTSGPIEYYETTTIHEDTEFIKQTPTSAHPPKKKIVPPPIRKKKAITTKDITKLNLIEDTKDLVDETPMVDEQDIVAPPEPEVDEGPSVVAPIVAPAIEEENIGFVHIAEQMPRFTGCEDMGLGKKEKESCARKSLMEYIYKNLKYPAVARDNRIEGLAVLQFVVTKDGKVSRVQVMKDPGGGCAAAVVKVVNKMNDLPAAWIPGKQRGKAVSVLFTLPVKFKLN